MSNSSRQDLGLLALRVGIGATMVAHGSQKLFGWFGGHGIAGTTGGMQAMGFHPAKPSAVLAGVAETGSGALLALGLATPIGGAGLASNMFAAGSVHKDAGFFAMQGGYEYPAVLGLTGLALAITGPGGYSLDRVLGDRLDRPWMVVAALSVMGSVSAFVVAQRAKRLAAAAPGVAGDQPRVGEKAASEPGA